MIFPPDFICTQHIIIQISVCGKEIRRQSFKKRRFSGFEQAFILQFSARFCRFLRFSSVCFCLFSPAFCVFLPVFACFLRFPVVFSLFFYLFLPLSACFFTCFCLWYICFLYKKCGRYQKRASAAVFFQRSWSAGFNLCLICAQVKS